MIAKDKYGNDLRIGDTVTIVGSSGEYIINNMELSVLGPEMMDIIPVKSDCVGKISHVRGDNLIKVS